VDRIELMTVVVRLFETGPAALRDARLDVRRRASGSG